MLERGWLQRSSLGPCGSSVTSCSARSFFTFSRQHCAQARKKRCSGVKPLMSGGFWSSGSAARCALSAVVTAAE